VEAGVEGTSWQPFGLGVGTGGDSAVCHSGDQPVAVIQLKSEKEVRYFDGALIRQGRSIDFENHLV
jgi:hypothetical protein